MGTMVSRTGLTILCIALLAPVHRASAHAILLSATPAEQQVVLGSVVSVQLRFNSRIDGKRSRVTLIAPNGTPHPLPIEEQTSPDTLTAQAERLTSGAY